MFNVNFDSKDRIIKAKVSLNRDRPFFAYILMNMNIEKTKSCEQIPTMGVNQYGDLFWNDDFVKGMSDDELQGVLAHEVLHIATLTFQREGQRDKMIWNMATDIAINYMLCEEKFSLPSGVLLPKNGSFELKTKKKTYKLDVTEKCAEEIYDWLMQYIEVIKDEYGTGEGGEGNGNYKGGLDSHLPGDSDSKGDSQGKGGSEADQRANEENWKQKATDAATAAKARGNRSAALERELSGMLEPKIDWRKRLESYITKDIPVDFTMRRPGRRFYATGCYFPSVVKENLEVVVANDISGSISDEEYCDFISECAGIAGSFAQIKMRVLWWSTYIDEHDDLMVDAYNTQELIDFRPTGGGGTTMGCIKDYVMKKQITSRIFVILTDGYIESEPELPDGQILFVLSKNGSDEIVKKYGEVCKLSDVERHMDSMNSR